MNVCYHLCTEWHHIGAIYEPIGTFAMKNRANQKGFKLASHTNPIGTSLPSAPTTNRGGKSEKYPSGESDSSGANRHRISLSVPGEIKSFLESVSSVTGLSLSQVALSAILSGLPILGDQVKVIRDCDRQK